MSLGLSFTNCIKFEFKNLSKLFNCTGGKSISFVITVGMQGEQLRRKKVIEIVDESPDPLGSKK